MDILPFFLEDDEELFIYHSLKIRQKSKRNDHHQVKLQESFKFNDLTDDYCWLHFRFYKNDLIRLARALGIPGWLKCYDGGQISGIEGLCIVLKRLAYPNRLSDLMRFFPRTRCRLSRVFNQIVKLILENHGHRLAKLNQAWLTPEALEKLANCLVRKGSPYKECFGFLNGTVRPVCRPKINQREFYNGHKRTHAIKFQSLLVPNGLILHLFGPVVGRRHDGYLLQSSCLIRQLERRFFTPQGLPYHLYGDVAYPLLPHLITPFKAHNLTRERRACNKVMSSIRESVEWGFNKIIQLFAFLDYKKNLKIAKQPVDSYYRVGAILTNCHTCLYGSQTSFYFDIEPPQLEEYLS